MAGFEAREPVQRFRIIVDDCCKERGDKWLRKLQITSNTQPLSTIPAYMIYPAELPTKIHVIVRL